MEKCFVGQGTKIGENFSAKHSVFFANCEMYQGEATNVFAGPFSVSHHKSTLLIAGMFSFFNAGSGTNQSNHMYKLGPNHQGVMERGCKTGSGSYMLWPSKVGTFTNILGKHTANIDSSDFPFSSLKEINGKSILSPSVNLFNIGTKRDIEKWEKRDQRKDKNKIDNINYNAYNPFTIGKIIKGLEKLENIDKTTLASKTYTEINGALIKNQKVKSFVENYKSAIKIFIGNEVVNRLEKAKNISSFIEIQKKLQLYPNIKFAEWVDLSGSLTTVEKVDEFSSNVKKGKLKTIDEINLIMNSIHDNFSEESWNWTSALICSNYKNIKKITPQVLIQIISNWKEEKLKFNSIMLKDAGREFSLNSRISYGIDGNEKIKIKDFESIHGKFENEKFVVNIINECKEIELKAKKIITQIKKLK